MRDDLGRMRAKFNASTEPLKKQDADKLAIYARTMIAALQQMDEDLDDKNEEELMEILQGYVLRNGSNVLAGIPDDQFATLVQREMDRRQMGGAH